MHSWIRLKITKYESQTICMTKTYRKNDKEKRPWDDILHSTKQYLQRKQEEQDAEEQIREAKRLCKDNEGED